MERRAEPGDGAIAIVGMAFRFPGGCADEASFWQALVDQQDLVTQVPAERWALDELQHARRSEPGRSVTFAAGVVDHVDAFDAAFFNISPREAAWLDPQQRLLLELSWEAFENAGIRPSTLAGTDCAVYVGISSLDYGTRGLDDLASLSAHSMTGNTLSVVANRLSYFYDLRGPSLAVDTACSSSLVALHQACRALQTGEAGSALVGGVSLLLHPYPFIGFTKASMLSATGRCRPFDAAGDGYVRAEGGAVLMLKPCARALADGDTIRAVILASGTNTDGARKTGLTIPSSTAQAELMRAVLARSGLGPDEVAFVEAHGTGTPVGDPVEAQALGAAYGRLRTEPLPIGSVKANLGHMEAAAGMAGLVKTVLALEHGVLPGLLHLETPNPHIDFEELNLRPTARNLPLEPAESGRALAAGVSAFGFGGANAHLVLQAAPVALPASHCGPPAVALQHTALSALPPLFISAHDEAALRALAGRWAEQFAGQDQAACYDLVWSAAFHRDRLARRLVLQADTGAQAADALRRFAAGENPRELLLRDLADLRPGAASRAQFVSAVSGELADGTSLDARYWWRNVREPVRFVAAVSRLAQLGCRSFIEIGPHAILQRYLNEILATGEARCRALATARRHDDGLAALRQAVGRAWLLADEPRLKAAFPVPGRRVRLPAYPWQRERHWHARTVECLGAISRERVHPLLGWPQAGSSTAWENTLDDVVLPWLGDHRVGGAVVFPAAGFAEMAVAAARAALGGASWLVEGLDILAPLVLQGGQACTLRLDLNPRDGNITIRARARLSDAGWTVHATARVVEGSGYQPLPRIDATPSGAQRIDHDEHYRLAASVGLEYGTAFRTVRCAHLDGDVLEAELEAPAAVGSDYLLHPGLLDGALQTLVDFHARQIEAGERKALLPVRIGRLLRLAGGTPARVRARLVRRSARSVLADFELLRADGTLCMRLDACRFRAVALDVSDSAPVPHWRIELQPLPHPHDLRVRELPPLAELLEAASASLAALDPERTRWFRATLPLREVLVLAFAREACQKLAQERGAGWLQLLDGPEASPFARWIAALLRQEQILVAGQGDEWGFAREVDLPSADEIWQNLVREQSGSVGWLARVARWGEALPSVLAGEADASGLLAELRGSPLVDGLYRDDPDHLGVRLALPAIVQSIVARAPAARLRVLECTLDTDGAGRALVAALPAGQHDCVLAVGNAQLETGACIEHGDRAAIEVAACDPGAAQPLSATGAEHLDLIIFHHSLHALADPLAALAQARERLAPGGLLIVVERHPDWTAQFLDGLDPSWWLEQPASDGIPQPAPVPPLLCPDAWQGLLEESGFESCVAWKEAAARDLAEGAFLVLASAPRPECERAGLALPDGQAHAEAASWVLLADPAGMACAERLREQLEARGERVRIGAHWPAEVAPEASEAPAHVVSLRGWKDGPADAAARVAELAMLAQRLADEPAPARLWVVTRGGALAGELPATVVPNPTQAALWGLGRVLMNEVPVLACTLIELGLPEGSDEVARLARELLAPDGAREIVSLPQGRQVLVLREADAVDTRSVGRAGRFRLDFDVPGQLQRLRWHETAEQPLAAGEVEVRTQAAGLNFRDVMYLMGLLPDEAVEDGFAGASLGLECAGVVRRVGPEVHGLRVGDMVMGFGSACFASHVVTRADALLRIPAGWSCAAAATVPTAFFTAYYALSHLAGLQQGERVLIHGAAGGVGMAAIQLARHRGAEIFATAGTADKRAFVRLLGADHVLDSRSLAFADEIMARTEGKGVDVVLNSLAGEAMRRSIDLLKPFGRFLELGKRDFFENTPLGLRPFRRNISYFGIDADQLLTVQPALAARLLGEVMVLFDQGVLSPLPCRSFAADQVVDAFRVMQQARHIGKLVIDLDGTAPALVAARKEPAAFRLDEGTWVVSGGLGGFGLASARWLADQGVRELALLGRRGLETPGAAQLVAEFAARGVRVCIHACDVSEAAAVELALAEIRRQQPPLAGVLHAAAVYEDRLLADVDLASVRRVLAAKLQGAWNLHDATRADPLRHFILYGSIATAIGNPGQAAYVAASAGVESLAALRTQLGLPVRCISWGPIGDVGYLARQAGVRTSLAQRLGREPLAARQALAELGPVLRGGTASSIVADFDWHTLARLLPSADSHRFARIGRKTSAERGAASDIRAMLREKPADEARRIVSNLIRQEVAQTLSLAPERIAVDRPLSEMGMDSLMAVELVLGIEARFGVRLPVMSLGDAASVARIVQRIMQGIEEGAGAAQTGAVADEAGADERIAKGMAARHGEALSAAQLQSFQADAQDLARAEAGAAQ